MEPVQISYTMLDSVRNYQGYEEAGPMGGKTYKNRLTGGPHVGFIGYRI